MAVYVPVAQTAEESDNIITIGSLSVNTDKKSVENDGEPVPLTDMEYNILKLLITNRRKVFSIEEIYENVWGKAYLRGDNNTVMVHIRRLRMKTEDDPQNPKYVKTVWGRGYMIE